MLAGTRTVDNTKDVSGVGTEVKISGSDKDLIKRLYSLRVCASASSASSASSSSRRCKTETL